jgi:restriction endonuclease Mrr
MSLELYRKFIADLVDMTDYAHSQHKQDVVDKLVHAIEHDRLDKEALAEFLTATRCKPIQDVSFSLTSEYHR